MQALLKKLFGVFNRLLMVPLFRLGLGWFVGNPLTGYIMVLKTIGRKSGKVRYTPVNYAILNGLIYCIAGFGKTSQWYRNLQLQPRLEVLLPAGALAGLAETVCDPAEAVTAFRLVLKSAGFAGFFYGFNPHSAPEETLRKLAAEDQPPAVRALLADCLRVLATPADKALLQSITTATKKKR
mgnify:CR=1 FL=1